MTLYLIDANTLIDANQDYYPLDRIPAFWDWLLGMAITDVIKMPYRVYNEVAPFSGPLPEWLRQSHVEEALVLHEPTDMTTVQRILAQGYAPDLNDVEIEKIGRDPFLIAAALVGNDRVVVSREVSKPSATRANRKVPDVCSVFSIPCITDFTLYRTLSFSIK